MNRPTILNAAVAAFQFLVLADILASRGSRLAWLNVLCLALLVANAALAGRQHIP